jgi:hypothetical protein
MARRLGDAAPSSPRPYASSGPDGRSGTVSAYELAQRRGGGRGRGPASTLRLVLFLLLAAGLVLVGLVTIGRPIIRGVVVGLAGDNPGALGVGFVADMVREDLGTALT